MTRRRSDNTMYSSYMFPDSAGKDALDRVGREMLGMGYNASVVPETAAEIEGGGK